MGCYRDLSSGGNALASSVSGLDVPWLPVDCEGTSIYWVRYVEYDALVLFVIACLPPHGESPASRSMRG